MCLLFSYVADIDRTYKCATYVLFVNRDGMLYQSACGAELSADHSVAPGSNRLQNSIGSSSQCTNDFDYDQIKLLASKGKMEVLCLFLYWR